MVMKSQEHEVHPADRRPLVVALTLDEARPFGAVALALARRGYSVVLVREAPGGDVSEVSPSFGADALLDLQLAIERAGGISLAGSVVDGGSLQWAVEAFGRLDVVCVWSERQAAALSHALAGLEGRAMPRRMVVLSGGGPVGGVEELDPNQIDGWDANLKRIPLLRLSQTGLDWGKPADASAIDAAVEVICGED